MKIVYNWLKEFVSVDAAAADLRARLSLAGIAIDSLEESAAGPVLDAEITANRPDCLGHYGVARETAALYRLPLKPVQPLLKESAERVADATRVEIEAPDLCGHYTARVLRGVHIQPSPDWLRQRLEAVGQNSVNNVVDATNYVMFELGQPLHAFDLEKLHERRIVVRRAREGEKIRTLDGAERLLSKKMCVIADAAHAVAIAGVMGGAGSEISPATRHILLESAWFDPFSVRGTSKALNLRTEASYRFERGVDMEMAELASQRAAELIQQFSGGEILSGVIEMYPARTPAEKIRLSRAELLRVMGSDVPDRDLEQILEALGFQPKRLDATRSLDGSREAIWECRPASWRRDVSRQIDLIEEVARHYGYDKFPPRLPPAKQPARRLPHAEAQDRLRECLIASGYQEIVEIPLVDARRDTLFRPAGVAPAVIGNPLAEDVSVMRSSGIVSMIRALEWNLHHSQQNLRLFEIGKTYELRAGEPLETPMLTLGITGLAREKTVHEPARHFEFADLKGDLDRIGQMAGGFNWQPSETDWLSPARAAQITINHDSGNAGAPGHRAAVAGQLARRIAELLKLRQDVYLAELPLEPLLKAIEKAHAARRFQPIPRFPGVERDFSLVLSDGIAFAQVAEAIGSLHIPELRSIEAADLFRGGQIPPGKFSLMIQITFQSAQVTLTDAQLADFSARIVATLERELGATLRAS